MSQLRQLSEVVLLNDAELEGSVLHPREQLLLQLQVQPQHIGILCTLLVFDFGKQGAVMRSRASQMELWGEMVEQLPNLAPCLCHGCLLSRAHNGPITIAFHDVP